MKLKGVMKYVGYTARADKKDASKIYYNGTFIQEGQAVSMNLKAEVIPQLSQIKEMDNVNVDIDLVITRDYTICNATSITKFDVK